MAGCNFSLNFKDSALKLIEKAEAAMRGANGSFNGDVDSGVFSLSTPIGKINGAYTIRDQVINFQISDKPIFLSCSKIQSELQKYLL